MAVVLRHSEALDLNVADYSGVITLEQLKAVAGFGAQNPQFLKADTLNIVREDTDFSGIDLRELDTLFATYRRLFAALNFEIYRRSAWLVLNKAAEAHVGHWLGGADLREAMSSAVRKFDSLPEAADWLLLGASDVAQVECGEGFAELARFDITAPAKALAR